MEQITFVPTFESWQRAARRALAQGQSPEEIVWEEMGSEQPSLAMFEESGDEPVVKTRKFRVPKDFIEWASRVACHRDPGRWALLYRVLWRLTHGESRLLEIVVDGDVRELMRMDKAVRHDVHKMRAFVRFRVVEHAGLTWHVAWFEPEHHIVARNAPFFRDRFAQMHWSILTLERCVHWDGKQLAYTGGVPKSEAPTEDAVEELWKTYYGNIFNPSRVKVRAMQAEMPKRYWKNLPEAALIPTLIQEAPARVQVMLARHPRGSTDEWNPAPAPATNDLAELRAAAGRCEACPLCRRATQTVFGEGLRDARLVLVGEQPGDHEDRTGRPFVGPAGQLLNEALREAGIDRGKIYVTNAVKHFKWTPRGKRRLHEKPNSRDIAACKPWLEAELRAIRPEVLVLLGGSAARSVLGGEVRVLKERGREVQSEYCENTVITVHPSAILRMPAGAKREQEYALFVQDLNRAAQWLRG